jgi:peptidylprolyl isomerase
MYLAEIWGNSRMRILGALAALCFALALSACGDDESAGDSGQAKTSSTALSKQELAKLTKPKVEVPDGPPPKKLVVEDLDVGTGPAAKARDEVTVHYVGVEYKNGKQIDSSWDRGETFSFDLGERVVIPGWEAGVPGMKVGGRRKLIIPSNLAYKAGALVFVIDLIAIKPPPPEPPFPQVQVPDGPPPKKLVVKDLEEGSGEPAKRGDTMSVLFVAGSYKTGKQFEAEWEVDRPFRFALGSGEAIEGWEEGLEGMKVHGRRELLVPSDLAYKQGSLVYIVELLAIE